MDDISEKEIKFKPSVYGFIRNYILSFLPIWILIVYIQIKLIIGPLLSFFNPVFVLIAIIFGFPTSEVPKFLDFFILLILMFLAFIVSWTLRSKEGTASTGLTLLLPFIAQIPALKHDFSTFALISGYRDFFILGAIISSGLVLLSIESYRHSIHYVLADSELKMSGGIWRKQEHAIPYNQIGRIVLEQSLFGKIFDYGTLIPLGLAEWGSEYYTRGVGTLADVGKLHPGVFYARTLKEASRDPLKCLYGIKSPNKIKEVLEKKITIPYKAEITQTEYLRKIYEKISEKHESENYPKEG